MRILTVCSGLDFINYTRKATIEAIHSLEPEMEVLMFNSVLNIRKKILISPGIKFHYHYFWVPEKLRKSKILKKLEHILRRSRWTKKLDQFEIIFLIDPNQYYLLHYINPEQKLLYLLRDPSVLQDNGNYLKEKPIIDRADAILGISSNLCSLYFEKYYKYIPENVFLWPNTVDTSLWDYYKWKDCIRPKEREIIGLAGNINYVIDLDLLIFLALQLPEYDFEIAGKINLNTGDSKKMKELLSLKNVRHLGFIDYDDFPAVVINWTIGIVAAKPDHEYSLYLNNNKQYQYLALGKPFVTYPLNADYSEFDDMVFLARSPEEFVNKIKEAVQKTIDLGSITRGIEIAKRNSSKERAEQFLNIIKGLTLTNGLD